MAYRSTYGDFPMAAAVLFGLSLGGFFDGIVFHQLLQWHHMVSSWYPPISLENLRINTIWDGLFHSLTWLFMVAAIVLLWRAANRAQIWWSTELLAAGILLGWGGFNLVEGLVDHAVLGIHHVNETVPAAERAGWDVAFLAWGAAMWAVGWQLRRHGNARRSGPVVRGEREAGAVR
jgi:uncharacterized membrane protein